MGADCACVKRKEEIGEFKTSLDEFQLSKSGLLSQRLTRAEKEAEEEEERFNDKLIEAINSNVLNEINKKVNASIIQQEEFEALMSKNKIGYEILSKLSSELNDIAYDKTGLFSLEPLALKSFETSECDYYYGMWNTKGQACGIGTLVTSNGSIYKGMFNEGLFNGKGVMISPKGDYYIGDWKNGECEGKGQLTNSLGYYFKGDFKGNKKCGKGIEHYPDGAMYEGSFEDNEKQGIGRLIFQDGASYEGNFNHSEFEGHGKYIWPDKRVYEGEFKSGLMNSNGKDTWEDGSIYSGGYANNKKCGQGIFIWSEANELAGNWINNEPHGKCIYLNNKIHYEIIYRFGKIISSKVINENYTNANSNHNNIPSDENIHFKKESQLNANAIPVLPRLNSVQNKEKIENLPDFVCQICHDLVEDPYQCNKCYSNYCYHCIYDTNEKYFKECVLNCKGSIGVNNDLIFQMKELKLQ